MPACTKNINVHLWEPINGKFFRACLAEFIAMFFFVIMCCGCAMVTLNDELDVNQNLMQVAASFGFGIMVIAQLVGPLSGGHINCAVSFALFVGGRISFIRLVCYTLSQMAGSVFGALFLWAIFGTHWQGGARAFGSNSWDEETFNAGKVFLAEALGTALLVFTVFATIDIPMQGAGPLGVFPIAMAVMVAHLFLLPIDGCSINPTRSFGPSLVAAMSNIPGTYQDQQYMFWLGPLFGATLAALIYGTLISSFPSSSQLFLVGSRIWKLEAIEERRRS
jgi:aquaporin-5